MHVSNNIKQRCGRNEESDQATNQRILLFSLVRMHIKVVNILPENDFDKKILLKSLV